MLVPESRRKTNHWHFRPAKTDFRQKYGVSPWGMTGCKDTIDYHLFASTVYQVMSWSHSRTV